MKRYPASAFILLFFWIGQAPVHGVHLKLGATEVIASGLPIEGQVAWIVAMRQQTDRVHSLSEEATYDTDWDGDGRITYPSPNGIPDQGLWIAVDLWDGSFAAAQPAPSAATSMPLSSGAIQVDPTGAPTRLMLSNRQARLVLVRVGTGAWTLEAADGGPTDLDGLCDGSLEISVDDFRPMTPRVVPIERFQEQDTLVVVDLETLEYTAHRVTINDLPSSRR